MSLHKETVRQLEEIYQKYLPYMNDFTKEEFQELYGMCKNCEKYMGEDHDYKECRDQYCFQGWLALEYLELVNSCDKFIK